MSLQDEVGGGVAPEYGALVSPAIDSIGAGVVVEDGAGLGEAASPTTTPVTPTTDLEKSEADGDGVAASAASAARAEPASAPMRTTARPSIRSKTENLRTGAVPRNPIGLQERRRNPSSEKQFVPPRDSLASR